MATKYARPVSSLPAGTKDLMAEVSWLRQWLTTLSERAASSIESLINTYLKAGMPPDQVLTIVQNMLPDIVNRYVQSAAEVSTQCNLMISFSIPVSFGLKIIKLWL